MKAQKEKESHAIMTTRADLLNLSILRRVGKNISELTIFANCYKPLIIVLWISSEGFGEEKSEINYVNLESWKINKIQLFPHLLSDPLVMKRDSLRRSPICQFLYW